ncbi:GntR family transcriptional regulator [Roseibium algae]|uniref:GntR family transcriptional regulator n=1 Tax=Roseibium algae TaxID=3123038 RepID=A0ABU8TGI2_9HYPH
MQRKTKLTRVDNAYDRLKDEILQSKLPPGFQAPEPDIAERLGMSRTPVREALIRLESDGLVELVPRRGAKVLALSLSDLLEIYDLLIALEPAALSKLAGNQVAAEDLEALEALIYNLEKAHGDGDLDAWGEADDQFHRKLLSLSSNRRLAGYAGCLLDQVYRGRMVLLRMRNKPVSAVQDHRDLLAAVLSGDSDMAFSLCVCHLEVVKQALQEVFTTCRLVQV